MRKKLLITMVAVPLVALAGVVAWAQQTTPPPITAQVQTPQAPPAPVVQTPKVQTPTVSAPALARPLATAAPTVAPITAPKAATPTVVPQSPTAPAAPTPVASEKNVAKEILYPDVPPDVRKAVENDFNTLLPFKITEKKMIAFVRAAARVERINSRWDIEIASAATDQIAIENNNFAVEDIMAALKKMTDLTLDEYNQMSGLTAKNTDFARVVSIYRNLLRQGAFGKARLAELEKQKQEANLLVAPKQEKGPFIPTMSPAAKPLFKPAPAPDVPQAPQTELPKAKTTLE